MYVGRCIYKYMLTSVPPRSLITGCIVPFLAPRPVDRNSSGGAVTLLRLLVGQRQGLGSCQLLLHMCTEYTYTTL